MRFVSLFTEEGAVHPAAERSDAESPVEGMIHHEDLETLLVSLNKLKSVERSVILLIYFQGLSLRSVGRVIQRSHESVRLIAERSIRQIQAEVR